MLPGGIRINTRMGSILTREEALRFTRDHDIAEAKMRAVLGLTTDPAPALVIVGGLVTSTALNLFLLPTLYARFGRAMSRDV